MRESTKQKLRHRFSGVPKPPRSESHKKAISESKMGNRFGAGSRSAEARARISAGMRESWRQRRS
jgi:hypothetical protein